MNTAAVTEITKTLKNEGKSFADIAQALNQQGHKTPYGKKFNHQSARSFFLKTSKKRTVATTSQAITATRQTSIYDHATEVDVMRDLNYLSSSNLPFILKKKLIKQIVTTWN